MTKSPGNTAAPHLARGARGEELAARYLRERGFTIEKRNFETEFGELDIIARQPLQDGSGTLIAFVEVKSRSRTDQTTPELSVTAKKRRTITRVARYYADHFGRPHTAYRFDVITVDFSEDPPKIQHFDGAFDAAGNPY